MVCTLQVQVSHRKGIWLRPAACMCKLNQDQVLRRTRALTKYRPKAKIQCANLYCLYQSAQSHCRTAKGVCIFSILSCENTKISVKNPRDGFYPSLRGKFRSTDEPISALRLLPCHNPSQRPDPPWCTSNDFFQDKPETCNQI